MSKNYTGRCACGAIEFEFDTDPSFVANRHCNDCKKASGGESATFFAVSDADFTLRKGTTKTVRLCRIELSGNSTTARAGGSWRHRFGARKGKWAIGILMDGLPSDGS